MNTERDIAAAIADASSDREYADCTCEGYGVWRYAVCAAPATAHTRGNVTADPFEGLDVPFTDMEGIR